jgi:hypothetical protein
MPHLRDLILVLHEPYEKKMETLSWFEPVMTNKPKEMEIQTQIEGLDNNKDGSSSLNMW